MIGQSPAIKPLRPVGDHVPDGAIIGPDARLGQQFGGQHAGVVNVAVPQRLRRRQTVIECQAGAGVAGQILDHVAMHTQKRARGLVIGGSFHRADGIGALAQGVQKRGHSTVTDFARLRGWSTSVPRCSAV